MKKQIVSYYRNLRRQGYSVKAARLWTADHFNLSVAFVATLIVAQ